MFCVWSALDIFPFINTVSALETTINDSLEKLRGKRKEKPGGNLSPPAHPPPRPLHHAWFPNLGIRWDGVDVALRQRRRSYEVTWRTACWLLLWVSSSVWGGGAFWCAWHENTPEVDVTNDLQRFLSVSKLLHTKISQNCSLNRAKIAPDHKTKRSVYKSAPLLKRTKENSHLWICSQSR